MKFSQTNAFETPQDFKPMLIPISLGLMDHKGKEIRKTNTFLLKKKKQSLTFRNLSSRPIPSTLRDFSAPITLIENLTEEELHVLAAHDKNLFNRWSALRKLSFETIENFINHGSPISDQLLSTIRKILCSNNFSHAYRAMMATPPSALDNLTFLSNKGKTVDPLKIHAAIYQFDRALFLKCRDVIEKNFLNFGHSKNYATVAEQGGLRAFRLRLLDLFCYHDRGVETVRDLYKNSTNMTDEVGSLSLLIKHDQITCELDQFYKKWKKNNNVIDKWFYIQAKHTRPKNSVYVVDKLTKHNSFGLTNPNRFKSVIGAFASNNLAGFHQEDGKGYKLVTDWLIQLDRVNPQITARVCTVFDNWGLFDITRQTKMKTNLIRLSEISNISKNTYEIVNAILNK